MTHGDDTDSNKRSRLENRAREVRYTSRRPRYHGFFGDYTITSPDQSDADLLETYYSPDIHDLPDKDVEYWNQQHHQNATLDAQFIRQGWIDEISQGLSTPDFDLTELGRTPLERAQGVLTGLAIGDALGRPVEFWTAEEIEQEYGFLDSMQGQGTHGQPEGAVTDDTEQALCNATSLISTGAWDPEDVAAQFVDWYSSAPFDVGATTAKSMDNLAAGMSWDAAGAATQAEFPDDRATNGSVMRCAPLAIAYPYDTDKLIEYSRQSSVITHAHRRCQFGAAILNLTIANILTYTETPLESALGAVREDAPHDLISRLSNIKTTDESALSSTGDVTDTLETAMYYGLTSSSFVEAVTEAVNKGGDTDTIGAITGAIAGARFGFQPTFEVQKNTSVPREMLKVINTNGLLVLPPHLLEIENGLGTFPKDVTWRSYISTITTD